MPRRKKIGRPKGSKNKVVRQPRFNPLDHITMQEQWSLDWAVARAKEWRGAIVGNPDPGDLASFNTRMEHAQRALRKLRILEEQGP